MRYVCCVIFASSLITVATPVMAQVVIKDSVERSSPQDTNPACLDRNGPVCVLDDGRGPRVLVPPGSTDLTPVTGLGSPATGTSPQLTLSAPQGASRQLDASNAGAAGNNSGSGGAGGTGAAGNTGVSSSGPATGGGATLKRGR